MSDVKRNKFSVKVNATGTTKIKMGTETVMENNEQKTSPSWSNINISSLIVEIEKLKKDSAINMNTSSQTVGVRG